MTKTIKTRKFDLYHYDDIKNDMKFIKSIEFKNDDEYNEAYDVVLKIFRTNYCWIAMFGTVSIGFDDDGMKILLSKGYVNERDLKNLIWG